MTSEKSIKCAINMTFLKNGTAYMFNIDWLSYNVRLLEPEPELVCPEGYRLELLPGNNIFKNRLILRDEGGAKILTCLWCPFSRVIDKRTMTVQVANRLLYESGIKPSFELLQQVVDCEFNTCSRIDFCCDFVGDGRILSIVRKLNSGAMYVEGKREGSVFWHETDYNNNKSKFPHCLSWGSKTTQIKVKLYNKSREQNLTITGGTPDKPYIVEEWQLAGVDITKVWRLEFSLTSAGLMTFDGYLITLDMVDNPTWFVGIFMKWLNTRFVIRKNQGKRKGHHNNDEIVEFLPLKLHKLDLMRKPVLEHRYPDADQVTSLRKLLILLEQPTAQSSIIVFDSIAESVLSIVSVAHLDYYCEQKLGKPIGQYLNDMRERVGGGINVLTPAPSKTWC